MLVTPLMEPVTARGPSVTADVRFVPVNGRRNRYRLG
jgi:hypothetical protein